MQTDHSKIAYALNETAQDIHVDARLFQSILSQIPEKKVKKTPFMSPYFTLALSQVVTTAVLVIAFMVQPSPAPQTVAATDNVDQAFKALDESIEQFEVNMDIEDTNLAFLESSI